MDSLDKAIANIARIYGHPVERQSLRFLHTQNLDPETFLQQPLMIDSGWLRGVPTDQWVGQLNTVYGVDFSEIVNRYLDQEIAPAISIDDYPGHGQLMALLLHSQGLPVTVHCFKSVFQPSETRDPRSSKLQDVLRMSNKHRATSERRDENRRLRAKIKNTLKLEDYLNDADLYDKEHGENESFKFIKNLNVGGLVRWSKTSKDFVSLRKKFSKPSDRKKISFLDDRHISPYVLGRQRTKNAIPTPWKTAEQLAAWLEEAYVIDPTGFNKMLKKIRFSVGECKQESGGACWSSQMGSEYQHDLATCQHKNRDCLTALKREKERLFPQAHDLGARGFRQRLDLFVRQFPCLQRQVVWLHDSKKCHNIRKYISRLDQLPEIVKLFIPRAPYLWYGIDVSKMTENESILTEYLLEIGILDEEQHFKKQISQLIRDEWSDESL